MRKHILTRRCGLLGPIALVVLAGMSAGEEVTLTTMRRAAATSREQARALAGRMTLEEWTYHDPAPQIEWFQKHSAASSGLPKDLAVHYPSILKAKASLHERRQYTWDGQARQYLARIEDLRDTQALLRQFGLPDEQGPNISLGKTSVLAGYEGGKLVTASHFELRSSLVIEQHQEVSQSDAMAPVNSGLASPEFFDHAQKVGARIERAAAGDGGANEDLVKVSWTDDGTEVVGLFDPSIGYRVRRMETRDRNGRMVAQETANDYRVVDGTPFPFEYEMTTWDPQSGEVSHRRKFKAEQVEFGINLEPRDFLIDVPKGTQVLDYYSRAGSALGVTRAEQAFRVDLGLAILLAQGRLNIEALAERSLRAASSQPWASRPSEDGEGPLICEQCDKVVKSEGWRFCAAKSDPLREPLILCRVPTALAGKILVLDQTDGGWRKTLVDLGSDTSASRFGQIRGEGISFVEKENVVTLLGSPRFSLILATIEKLASSDRDRFAKDAKTAANVAAGPRAVVIDCSSAEVDMRALVDTVKADLWAGTTKRLVFVLNRSQEIASIASRPAGG